MRKFIVFLLVFTIVFGSITSFAAPGDIIHTGLKKIYGSRDMEDLVDDIIKGVDTSKFYEEIEGEKFINVQQREDEKLKYLGDLVVQNNIKTPEELAKYIEANKAAIEAKYASINSSIAKAFNDISDSGKGNLDDYIYSSAPLRLTGANFSTPEPGKEVGTTKISRITLPSGSFNLMVKISYEPDTEVRKGTSVTGWGKYIVDTDIEARAGDYLNLYAVDRNDKIVGFASVKLLDNMIRKPIVYPEELIANTHYMGPEPGTAVGSTHFSDLSFQNIDADQWYVFTSKYTIAKPELDSAPIGRTYTIGSDISATFGDRMLLTAVKDSKVKAYKLFTLTDDNIRRTIDVDDKTKAVALVTGTHFSNPVKGSDTGSTKFEWLNAASLSGNIVWRYAVSDKIIPIPELDSIIEVTEDIRVGLLGESKEISVTTENEILSKGTVNKNIMLLATVNDGDGYKIKGYAMIKANDSNVKLPNAGQLILNQHYTNPVKGTAANTTKINTLDSTGIAGFNQWRYKLVKRNVGSIEFNSLFSDSSSYSAGNNIPSPAAGDNLVIAATDLYSRVKMYAVIKLQEEMIRGNDATYLLPITNYSLNDPLPGNVEGSTKFTTLHFSTNVVGASKWMVAKDTSSFGYIEIDSKIESKFVINSDYKAGTDLTNVKPNDYILLLATDDAGNVKGFKEFRLTGGNIRGGKAVELKKDLNFTIEKGNAPSTTRFSSLKFDGVYGATNWKILWLDTKLEESEIPYLDKIVDGANFYNIYNNTGQDINVSWVSTEDKYGYVLLMAVDSMGKTKGYSLISVDNTVVKEHASQLGDNIVVKPGDTADKVAFHGLSEGKTYKYILQDREYPTPAKDDILVNGQLYNEDITVRISQHLTLFEVDGNNRIQGFKRFVISNGVIKQGTATLKSIEVPEGSIVNGGTKLEITLTGAKWADLKNNKYSRDRLFSGFLANNQVSQWINVVNTLISDGGGVDINNDTNTLTIYLAKTTGYNINEDQLISLTIPAEAIDGAVNPIIATGNITIKPTITANISGDVISKVIRESDIKNGGTKIVITLLDGSWIGDVNKNTLIDGFQGGAIWSKIASYKDDINITRNSSKEITITLPEIKDITSITSKEEITLTIPKELISGATMNVVATPSFSIHPNILKVSGMAMEEKDTVIMQAPDGKEIFSGNDTWKVKLTNSTFKTALTDKDIVISNLPAGLKYAIERIDDKNISIKLSGTSSASLSGERTVLLKIKGSAVTDLNSLDSDEIQLKIEVNEPLGFAGISYEIKVNGIYLLVNDATLGKIQYSINSTNGINGTWTTVNTNSQLVSSSLTPVKIWAREVAQPKVYKDIINLGYGTIPDGIVIKDIKYVEKDIVIDGETIKKTFEETKLEGITTSMEYSLDGGINWISFEDIEKAVDLDAKSDLRVRLAPVVGTTGSLPSLSTKKLNGLFLGDVKLQVGAGKISGTNTSMQYSLNSTNGIDGDWKVATPNEANVVFGRDNKVWIREGSSKVNFRFLGDVKQKEKPIATGITYHIGNGWINNTTDQDLEYRIAGGSWSSLNPSFNITGIEFMAGDLEIRTKGNGNTLPSLPITLANIPAAIDPPELKGDDNEKLIYYMDGAWKLLDNNFQYKVGSNGIWKNGGEFKNDEVKNQSVMVYVRKKADEKTLPSKEKALSFTKNLTFENIKYNVAAKVLEGTTPKIEYSINSTSDKNGIWKKITSTSTSIDPFEGMYLWIREENKPSSEILLVPRLVRQSKPTLDEVDYNVELNKIDNKTDQNLDFRVNEGNWQTIDANSDRNDVIFEPGKLEFRIRATRDYMESHAVTKVVIKSPASPPTVVYSDITNTIISINGIQFTNYNEWGNKFQYRINPKNADSPWLTGDLLAKEDLSGNKTLEVRIKADRNTLPSQIRTIGFAKNLDLQRVTLSQHVSPFVLNGTTVEMDYQIYFTPEAGGERTEWVKCNPGDTVLPDWLKWNLENDRIQKIEIRDGREGLQEDIFLIWSRTQ